MAKRGLILDLNGTIYFKEKAFSHAAEILECLRAKGYILRFVTNTDTKTRQQLHELIISYGLDIPVSEIFSAAHATFQYLKTNNYSFTGLLPKNLEADFSVLKRDELKPDCVIIGENREAISYETLDMLFRHIMNGAELIIMQPGRHYHLADGPHLDTGAIAAMFEYATGNQGNIMAKPSVNFFKMVLKDMKLKGEQIIVIGDDIETDLIGASKIGAKSILIKTGKYQSGDEFMSSSKPSLVIDNLSQLPAALERLK